MKRRSLIAATSSALGVGALFAGTAPRPGGSPVAAADAEAALATVTFDVDGMWCALCPLTVKTAMERVDGVRSVEVDYRAQSATVAFDPILTSDAAIALASTDAGYPATARRPAG